MGVHQGQPADRTQDLPHRGNTTQIKTILIYLRLVISPAAQTGRHPTVIQCYYHQNSPKGINQLGHSLTCIIHAFAETKDDTHIFMAKWDIKDGFWWMDAEEGAKWNFAYVLPQSPGKPIYLVVPTSLQMG